MKQRFTILIAAAVMLLAILLQPVRLWGQTRATGAYKTLSFPDDNNANNHVGAYNMTWTATIGSDSWSIANFNNNNWSSNWKWIKCGNKNAASTGTITTSFAVNKPVKSVTIYIGNITAGKITSISLYSSSNGSTWGSAIGTFTKSTGNQTVTISSPTKDLYYKIEAVCQKGSGNGLLQIDSVKYNVETFTVTYNSNGGSGTMTDSNSPYWTGSTVTTKTNTFTAPTGFTFNGWNTAANGSGTAYAEGATFAISANTTLYAQWIAAGDYITVAPTSADIDCNGDVAEFNMTTSISTPSYSVAYYTTSAGDETTDKPSWFGDVEFSGNTLDIEVTENTGAARSAYFKVYSGTTYSDVITINQAVYAPAVPTIPETTSFDYTMNVTMSQAAGKTIYYTTDGSTPNNTSTEYTGAFDINATTTVKAIAYDGSYPSAVVSATYTRTYKYINEITAAGTYTVKGTVVAVYGETGFVLGDGTGYIYDYKSSHGLSVGNKVSITSGTIKAYNHVWEFDGATTADVGTSSYTTGTPAITTLTSSIISSYSSATNLSTYFEVVGEYSNSYKEITVSGSSIPVRLSTTTDYSSLDEKTVKAKGYFLGFNKDTQYFYLCPESVEAVPVVTTSVSSISNFTYNVGGGPDAKSFTVSGANLTDDITVSTNSANFELSSDNETWQTTDITISKGSGTVAATTIYVRLKSGLSSATYNGKITVSSDGADDKEIALTGTVTRVIAYNTSLPTGCSVSSEPNGAQVAGESVSVSATAGSGYKFSAWDVYKTGDATTKVTVTDNAFTMPDYNVTVSATFVSAYTVTYDSNGGTGTMTDENSPYASGSPVTVLTNKFTREGYDFSSWNTQADGSGSSYDPDDDENNTFTINKNTTLYAQWTAAKYNVALSQVANVDLLASYNEETIAEDENANVPYGTEITLSASNMDAGKVFVWSVTKNEDSSDVTDDVLDGDVLTVPAYNITIGGSVEDVKAVYTVVKPSTTITVSSSGICPAESTASYSTTYNTLGQLTAGNYMTLTLSGYQNQIIKGIDLEMHSNAPGSGVKGAGYMSAVVGTDTIAKVGKSTSAVNFNEWPGMTAYTSSYTNVSIPMTLDTRKIEDDETIVIKITATANSLYCDKFTIYYETSTTPVINAENVNLVYTATSGEIPYTITNPNGSSLSAVKTTGDWISAVTVDGANSKVTFTTTANSGVGREGSITLSYTGASDKVVKVYQEAQKYTVTYAGNGGTGSMTDSNSPYEYGADVTLLDNTFTAPSGKMFNGWSVTDGSSNPVTTADGKFTMPNSNVTVTAQWRDKDKFELVNSTEGLLAGKHYIITNGTTGTVFAMGYQNTSNRPKSDTVSFDGSGNIYEDSDIWDFVLSGDATNGWTFYDKYTDPEGFLYASSSSNNELKLQDPEDLDNNGKWTIEFSNDSANIVAKGTNSRKYLRYNKSAKLFSCYAKDKQDAIYLYVKVDDQDYEIYSPSPITDSQEIESLVVEDVLTIMSGATLTVTGALTNTTAANLVIEDGGQLILPDNTKVKATVKKATAGSSAEKTKANNLYAISSPVDGIIISPDNDGFAQGTHNVYQYYEPTTTWQEYRNENNEFDNLAIGRGYLYRSSVENIELAGNVTGGDKNGKVEYTLSYACGVAKYKGLNLVGNPFTHDITWSDLLLENVESAGCYMLVEDPESGDHGKWKAVASGKVTVKPMQAFFVQATDEDASITFNNTAGGGKGVNYANDNIMFSVKNSKCSDEAYVMFMEGHGLNKIEHRNNEIPMLYIMNNGQNYAIADMSDDTEAINVGFEAKTMGQYSISIKTEGQYSYMHLYDKVTGDDIDMLVEESYTFVGAPNDRKDRFVLNLNYNAANINTESDIFAYQSGSDIIIRGDGELHVFDVMGRMVATQRINGVETMHTSSLQTGVYIFRLEDKTQKIVVR